MKKNSLQFVNLLENPFPLWEYCTENNFTDLSYEEWYQGGGDLSFFEGDPDMVKIDGETGFFAHCGDKVFFWIENYTGKAEKILRAFFTAFEVGITRGGESWMSGHLPKGCSGAKELQSWQMWERLNCGIAYRGGAGYTYTIQSWGNYLRYAA